MKLKRLKPIRIHSIYFGYGWWWFGYFFFFKPFAVVPMWSHYKLSTYTSGRPIEDGATSSLNRQEG